MRLHNPTDKNILFKIKTTAPKKYCVRPNCGNLDPLTSVEVSSKYLEVVLFLYFFYIFSFKTIFDKKVNWLQET